MPLISMAVSRMKASTKLIEQHLVKERDGISKLKLARYLLHIPLRSFYVFASRMSENFTKCMTASEHS